jgi:hypothetical protein
MSSRRVMFIALLCLTGCADLHWERAIYEGQRSTAEQCRIARRASDPPCPRLPAYDQYEKERASAKGAVAAQQSRVSQRG